MRSFGVAFFMCKYKNGPGLHRFSVKPGAMCV